MAFRLAKVLCLVTDLRHLLPLLPLPQPQPQPQPQLQLLHHPPISRGHDHPHLAGAHLLPVADQGPKKPPTQRVMLKACKRRRRRRRRRKRRSNQHGQHYQVGLFFCAL